MQCVGRRVVEHIWRGIPHIPRRIVAIRWQTVAIRCQAVDGGASQGFHRLATGGYGRKGGYVRACLSIDMSDRQIRRRIGNRAYRTLAAISSPSCFLRVLCVFAVRLFSPVSNQHRQEEVSRQGAKLAEGSETEPIEH